MTIKAIETRYAGCRFRSRLEARWAVFFDTLGVPWEYEPEGFMIGPEGEQHPYLPDFWLPSHQQWVEVKGSTLTPADRLKIVHAVIPHWGLPNAENGILLLGGIPHPPVGVLAWHHAYTFHKGDLYRTAWLWSDTNLPREWRLACGVDRGGWDLDVPGMENIRANASSAWNPTAALIPVWAHTGRSQMNGVEMAIGQAYLIARSARFEHGETPRSRPSLGYATARGTWTTR